MYDPEDNSAPYDNVEFPIRKPGTGTWPGIAAAAGKSAVRLHGHQTIGRNLTGAKLAPLVEVEGSENGENNRLQTISFSNTSSTLLSGQQQQQQQQQQQGGQIKPTSSSYLVPQSSKQGSVPSLAKGEETTLTSVSQSGITGTKTSSLSSTSGTTTSAVSSNQLSRQTLDKVNKPVIVIPNDSSTYSATQITPEKSKKKTLKQLDNEEDDFKRQDLNPGARVALERVYTRHPDFYQLNCKVLDEGSLLKQDVLDIYRKVGETLTYEQLLQGMLVDGERFLLGSCWLYYNHVQFLDVDGTRTLREPYGKGRVGLTNKRALFLSTETFTNANLEQFELNLSDQKKAQNRDGYKLEVSKRSTVTFKNIPINNFHSAEMEVMTGTAAQTKITKQPSCCACLGVPGKWTSTPPITKSISSRVLRVGVSMPPWQTRMFLDIHLDPSMSLTVARDFISQLHTFAPHMH